MIFKTYIDKFNTIVLNSMTNSGLNSCCELHHGNGSYSRVILYFDEEKIKSLYCNHVIGDTEKVRHILHLTNCANIDFTDLHHRNFSPIDGNISERETSFDLIFFLIPQSFDNGKGFDLSRLLTIGKKQSKEINSEIKKIMTNNHQFDVLTLNQPNFESTKGSNWFYCKTGYEWKEHGIYSNETLLKEYEKFKQGEGSDIIFASQHFDLGGENINLDITEIVNKFVSGELKNYGIGIAFDPLLEVSDNKEDWFVSFFTNRTNSFFEPYVETIYDDQIEDNRGDFVINKNNKLYLYCNIGGIARNLDELPKCTIDDKEYTVKQFTTGVYYAEVFGDKDVFNTNVMYYDVWSNIKYDGVEFDDIEMDFVPHKASSYFNFGNTLAETTYYKPCIYGIKDSEEVKRGDIRKLSVVNRVNYSSKKCSIIEDVYYRLYILDGTRKIDVHRGWNRLNKTVTENFFTIDTNDLIPQKYYIDVKYKYNMEEVVEENILTFKIVDDLNNRYND